MLRDSGSSSLLGMTNEVAVAAYTNGLGSCFAVEEVPERGRVVLRVEPRPDRRSVQIRPCARPQSCRRRVSRTCFRSSHSEQEEAAREIRDDPRCSGGDPRRARVPTFANGGANVLRGEAGNAADGQPGAEVARRNRQVRAAEDPRDCQRTRSAPAGVYEDLRPVDSQRCSDQPYHPRSTGRARVRDRLLKGNYVLDYPSGLTDSFTCRAGTDSLQPQRRACFQSPQRGRLLLDGLGRRHGDRAEHAQGELWQACAPGTQEGLGPLAYGGLDATL